MACRARRAPLALILLSSLAWPNGGPVAWNDPAGAGDGAPLARSSIRLVREDLTITVGADPDAYDVEARYLLSNPGGATTVSYGVPITWGLMDEGAVEDKALQQAAAAVSLELAGARQGCAPRKVSDAPLLIGVPEQLGVDSLPVGAWCVTDLKIPAGDAIPLVLRYRANASFVDGETSKSAVPGWGDRDIVYPLFPAAGWAGKPAFQARLELGTWADDTTVLQPAGFRRQGSAWIYSNTSADLSALSTLVARVRVDRAKEAAYLSTWNAEITPYKVKLVAAASSTLSGGSYEAKNLLDGRADTAWCEGVGGDGVGQWIELRAAPGTRLPTACQLDGLAVIPGYTKSQAVYENNNRVRTMTISACGAEGGDPADLGAERRFDRSSGVIRLDNTASAALDQISTRFASDPASICVRLTIASVDRGAKFQDTCVSEAAALVNCG